MVMKILWFPRLQTDIDKLHITTWREMCRELDRKGVNTKIAIVGYDDGNIFNMPYIRIAVIKKKFLRLFSFLIDGYIKFVINYFSFKPDVIILDIYSIWFSFPLAIFNSKNKPLFIVDNRTPFHNPLSQESTLLDVLMASYTKLCYWYCNLFLHGVTVITEHYRQQVCKDFSFSLSVVGVWGSGVDVERFSPKHNNNNKPDFLKGKFVLMQHGEISYNRGLFETIEAISMINNKEVCLLLIGDSVAGSNAKEDIKQLIEKLKLEERVYLLPPVAHSEIPKYISYCDCAVMAYPDIEYWNNNNPIKLLEYISMGKVVICTDMWTFRNVMDRRKCAYYLNNNNAEEIVAAINYCYENRAFLYQWGRDGIEIINKGYTWRKQAENLLRFIDQLKIIKRK